MFTLVPILSRMNLVYTFTSDCLTYILIFSNNLRLCLPGFLFPFSTSKILYAFFISHAYYMFQLILLHFIVTPVMFDVD